MRALAIVHQPDAGPGVFAETMRSRGVELDEWLVPESGAPPGPLDAYGAAIVFGGAMHADQEERNPWLRHERALLAELLDRGTPLLGVCLGAQLLGQAAGGSARRASRPEIGWHRVEVEPEASDDPLLGPLAPSFEAFQWHSYEVTLPPGATPLARSDVCLQAYRIGDTAWGIQFHAEVSARDALAWIDDYRSDEDAVRIGVDAAALRERVGASIESWNAVGRALCERFLAAAAAYSGVT